MNLKEWIAKKEKEKESEKPEEKQEGLTDADRAEMLHNICHVAVHICESKEADGLEVTGEVHGKKWTLSVRRAV